MYLLVFFLLPWPNAVVWPKVAHTAETQSGRSNPPVLVIDPGHGGSDTGALGADKQNEKSVAMQFAQLLRQHLKSRYRILLTRDDDYHVPLSRRAAIANHAQADLFISVHFGASVLKQNRKIFIYYLEDKRLRKERYLQSIPEDKDMQRSLPRWQLKTGRFNEKSRYFAGLIEDRLQPLNDAVPIQIQGAPLYLLACVDRPGVLVEIGYLTNPADAQALSGLDHLNRYAEGAAKAVDDFFSDEPTL